ncbi:unnamed protein product [Urochloa humidicola]
MYVCGVTPYDDSHIGHARAYVAFDVLYRERSRKNDWLEVKIRVVLSVLGLLPSTYHEALQQLREKALRRASITEEHVLQKIEERTAARKAKQYEKSDEIRKELAAVGIALMDGPDGTTWRPSVPLSEEEGGGC